MTPAVGNAQDIAVVIDWTEFDADDQSTLVASLVTSQAAPHR
ncbi:hypothetical protein [Rhodovibrio sodomensis]|nr:hypothetical protein [Rhodovibrio sodomensis]